MAGRASGEVLATAAAICAGYSKAARRPEVDVLASGPDGRQTLRVEPLRPDDVHDLMI